MHRSPLKNPGWWLLVAAFALTTAAYWPGLKGGFLFDDYPNIVDNKGVQLHDSHFSSLVAAALSSPSSEFKRPLASLSFAANYLTSGLNPYWMKLTNLAIHLLNGLLIFLLAKGLLNSTEAMPGAVAEKQNGIVAALVTIGWMLLPINLTGVLYVVQRMESLANIFVLLGLIGYVAGRRRMLQTTPSALNRDQPPQATRTKRGFVLCLTSITIPTALGILAKETAVMLPLYAMLVEWSLFRFRRPLGSARLPEPEQPALIRGDRWVIGMFLLVLALPMAIGLTWLLPGVLNPEAWATRDFTLTSRLLSEARIIVDYIVWTLLPTPHGLSFYHDNFRISNGLLTPWTTLASIAFLGALITLTIGLRRRKPLVALGIALFLGCHLLTGTIVPLELIYEHRNYFASFGLLLAIVPLLAAPAVPDAPETPDLDASASREIRLPSQQSSTVGTKALPMALPRHVLLAGLLLFWTALTVQTSFAWGSPLRLAEELASRAPLSPRAQYELGRTFIIYSHYDPKSPFTRMAYAPLERSAALPGSSILPEQALIFMNARMQLPLKDEWWNSMIAKLKERKPGVQDESSLSALTKCVEDGHCDLPRNRMTQAFLAALSHPGASARLLATYGDYAWNVLEDHSLGLRMTAEAVKAKPSEPAYQITLIRMLAAEGRAVDAEKAIRRLESLNIGGELDANLAELRRLPALQ